MITILGLVTVCHHTVIVILLTLLPVLYIAVSSFIKWECCAINPRLSWFYHLLINYTWKCIWTLNSLHCVFYIACAPHTRFYLFLFHLVLKDIMRSSAVMPFGDNSAQTKGFKQMITFCLRSRVVPELGFVSCITVVIFCAFWMVCAAHSGRGMSCCPQGLAKCECVRMRPKFS